MFKKLLRCEITLWLLALPTLFFPYIFFLILAELRMENSLETARQNNIDLVYEHYIPPEIPDEENAWLVIDKAGKIIQSQRPKPLTIQDESFQQVIGIIQKKSNDGIISDADISFLREIVASYRDGIQLFQTACRMDRSRTKEGLRGDPVADFKTEKEYLLRRLPLGLLLCAQTIVQIHEKQEREALQAVKDLLRYGRFCFEEDLSLLSILLAYQQTVYSCLLLSIYENSFPIHQSDRDSILQEISRYPQPDLLSKCLMLECIQTIALFREDTHSPYLSISMERPFSIANQSAVLDTYVFLTRQEQLELASTDVSSVIPRWAVLAGVAVPNINGIKKMRDRCTAYRNMAQLSLALMDYHDRSAALPERIEDPALKLPDETITDPFSKKVFRYLRTEQGGIIYSIGFDVEDDGGVVEGELMNNSYDGDFVWTLSTARWEP